MLKLLGGLDIECWISIVFKYLDVYMLGIGFRMHSPTLFESYSEGPEVLVVGQIIGLLST